MFNYYLSLNQEQRRLQALDEQEQYLSALAEKQNQLRASGKFDGKCGLEPKMPEHFDYGHGYQFGLRHHWVKKLGRTIPTEFQKTKAATEFSVAALCTSASVNS